MKTFNELQSGDTIYIMNANAEIELCKIEGRMPRYFGVHDEGQLYGYDILFTFSNDLRLYRMFIEVRFMNDNIRQCKVYNATSGVHKNEENPYYLIGTNEHNLIDYYVTMLEKSISYQKSVVQEGLKKISELEIIVEKYKKVLEHDVL